jgi:chromosome segregation ATPase
MPGGGPVMDEQAAEQAAAKVRAERDAIQANLLELNDDFTKQLLDGAPLTGQTRKSWDAAMAKLDSLWETYNAYSAAVDRVAELAPGGRRPSKKDLPELTELLTGTSVRLTPVKAPLARRDLADTGRQEISLDASVAAMRKAFTEVAEVTSAVEAVWNEVGGRLDAVAEELRRARSLVAGLGDEADAAFGDAQSSLDSQRAAVNADPLALWRDGSADTSAADQLTNQVAGLTARLADLDRLRAQAQRRIDDLRTATAAAQAARQDVIAAWDRAAERIAGLPALPPDIAEPALSSLTALAAAGRWSRLQAELDRCESDLAASAAHTQYAERSVATALGRRDELRGLLGAYKAKAARLGAAEDVDLAARYNEARELLWTAPCDLAAAAAAVTGYQQAILAAEGRRR